MSSQRQNAMPPRGDAAASGQVDYAPLLHWDEKALAFVADKVGQAVLAWAGEWTMSGQPTAGTPDTARASACIGPGPAHMCQAFRLHADTALDPSAGVWLVYEKAHAAQRAVQASDLVGQHVYGVETAAEPGSIAAELAQEALAHLVAALRAALAIEGGTEVFVLPASRTALPENAFRQWSGGVRVSLPGLDHLALYLGGTAAARLDPPKRQCPTVAKAPLVTLDAAVAPAALVLRAQLRPVELTLGQISSLQMGDVVVLPHGLDHPLEVTTGSKTLVCEAYLGRSDRHRSLEVLPRIAPRGA